MDIEILDRLGDIRKIQKKVQGMNLGRCEIESISKGKVLFSVSFADEPPERIVVKGFSAE